MNTIDLVLFDMDGVLADTEPAHYEATRRLLAQDGAILPPEEAVAFLGGTDRAMFEVLLERYSLPRSVDEYVVRKEREVISVVSQGLLPNPGVCELLLQLKMRSLPSVVASGSLPRVIDAVVRTLGLERSFERLFSAQMVERGKPHPDLFLLAAREMGVEPSRCLVIEDSPNGIAAGRAAGMTVLALRTEFTRDLDLSEADRVVDSLLQFDLEEFA